MVQPTPASTAAPAPSRTARSTLQRAPATGACGAVAARDAASAAPVRRRRCGAQGDEAGRNRSDTGAGEQAGALLALGDVTDQRQHPAPLVDRDAAVLLSRTVEPADGGAFEGDDGSDVAPSLDRVR